MLVGVCRWRAVKLLRAAGLELRTVCQPFSGPAAYIHIAGAVTPTCEEGPLPVMSTVVLSASEPLEPDRCVVHGRVPVRSVVSGAFVVIVLGAWLVLVVVGGLSPAEATAGLGAASGLAARIAARLVGGGPVGGRDV